MFACDSRSTFVSRAEGTEVLHQGRFTKRHIAFQNALRGTFAVLSTADVVVYVKSLGTTSVWLLSSHSSTTAICSNTA